MIVTAISKSWTLKSSDIKFAFLQGKGIQRAVFIKPPVEAKRETGKVWRLKKTLYGLVDAAKQFYNSVREELLSLGMKQSKVDPALFYKVNDGEVIGALITHIDDFMHCGNKLFDDIIIIIIMGLAPGTGAWPSWRTANQDIFIFSIILLNSTPL